jgi:hypothetical protein
MLVVPGSNAGPGLLPEPNVMFTTGSPRLPWHNCAEVCIDERAAIKMNKRTLVINNGTKKIFLISYKSPGSYPGSFYRITTFRGKGNLENFRFIYLLLLNKDKLLSTYS